MLNNYNIIWGPSRNEARENLSDLAGFIIGVMSYYIKDFWELERDFLAEYVRFVRLFKADICAQADLQSKPLPHKYHLR